MGVVFNYSKLRGRIKEVCGSQSNFAAILGVSSPTLSAKLNNNVGFSQSEIERACSILGIPKQDLSKFFFTQ